MRNDHSLRPALRWWDSLRPSERIVAMSLATGGIVAIINSAVWTAAVRIMSDQRVRASIAHADLQRLVTSETARAALKIMGGAQ